MSTYSNVSSSHMFASILSPIPAIKSSQIENWHGEFFSFVPGWTTRKMDMIDFEGLSTLAFFDLPINADGTIDRDNDGYYIFTSDRAQELFRTAHANETKVSVTMTLVDNASIKEFLQSTKAQQTLIEETIQEMAVSGIDGVTIDFEYKGNTTVFFRDAFSNFIKTFATTFRHQSPSKTLSVAVPSTAVDGNFYDLGKLGEYSDNVFLMAYNYAVPEVSKQLELSAPSFGHEQQDYLSKVSDYIEEFLTYIPKDKLVVERAWYGNGENYPLTQLRTEPEESDIENTMQLPLSESTINNLVSEVPVEARAAVKKNLPLIAKALADEDILNPNVLAYALATIEHETAGTFEPIEEFKGRKSARRLGYEGGTDYFGRGFIQLTHLRNYKNIGIRIGLGDALVKNPALASDPLISAKVLAAFFKDNNIAALATDGNFIAARGPVNPDYQGSWIASLAYKFLYMLA